MRHEIWQWDTGHGVTPDVECDTVSDEECDVECDKECDGVDVGCVMLSVTVSGAARLV